MEVEPGKQLDHDLQSLRAPYRMSNESTVMKRQPIASAMFDRSPHEVDGIKKLPDLLMDLDWIPGRQSKRTLPRDESQSDEPRRQFDDREKCAPWNCEQSRMQRENVELRFACSDCEVQIQPEPHGKRIWARDDIPALCRRFVCS